MPLYIPGSNGNAATIRNVSNEYIRANSARERERENSTIKASKKSSRLYNPFPLREHDSAPSARDRSIPLQRISLLYMYIHITQQSYTIGVDARPSRDYSEGGNERDEATSLCARVLIKYLRSGPLALSLSLGLFTRVYPPFFSRLSLVEGAPAINAAVCIYTFRRAVLSSLYTRSRRCFSRRRVCERLLISREIRGFNQRILYGDLFVRRVIRQRGDCVSRLRRLIWLLSRMPRRATCCHVTMVRAILE